MDLSREHDRKGLVATILIHTILFLLLLIWTIGQAEDMLDTSGGVQVSFGDPEAGGADQISEVSEAQTAPSPSSSESQPQQDIPTEDDPMVTNDQSEAPEVVSQPKQTNTKPTEEVEKPKEEEQPKVDSRLADRLKKLKGSKKTGDQDQSSGPGIKNGPKGNENSDQPGLGGNSSGPGGNWTSGDGFSINGLGGFNVNSHPVITNESQEDGTVTLEICIDKYGKLTSTRLVGGTAASSSYLRDKSTRAVKQFVFSPNAGTKSGDCGRITFTYKLQ